MSNQKNESRTQVAELELTTEATVDDIEALIDMSIEFGRGEHQWFEAESAGDGQYNIFKREEDG
jgi:hypothetical protein